MIFIHDNEGKLVMHIDPVNGTCIGRAFEPMHMKDNARSSEYKFDDNTAGEPENLLHITDKNQPWNGYNFMLAEMGEM